MRLLLVEYLASLRERGELDAIIPDLVTQMGGTVVKIARRGESEQGKDVCAIFDTPEGKVLWVFVIKQGDLTEDVWQGSGNMRADAENALDVPFEDQSRGIDRNTKRKIILLHNGIVHEKIRPRVSGFCDETSSKRGIDIERWDIHGLAERFETHLLGERLLANRDAQRLLRQTLVLMGTQDYNLRHLNDLLTALLPPGAQKRKAVQQTFATVRLILSVITKFIGAEDIRPAIKAYELGLLRLWDWVLRINVVETDAARGGTVKLLVDYMAVLREYVSRIYQRGGIKYGLSIGGRSERVEYPMRVFEVLSNLSLLTVLAKCFQHEKGAAQTREVLVNLALQNPAAMHPLVDNQSIDIGLVTFALLFIDDRASAKGWVTGQLDRLLFRLKMRRKLPELYNRLDSVIEYEVTGKAPLAYEDAASTLMYMLFELLVVVGAREEYDTLQREFAAFDVDMQLWYPPADVEEHLFLREVRTGDTEMSIRLPKTYDAFVEEVRERKQRFDKPTELRTISEGKDLWVILLLACKYYGTPLMPFMWRAFGEDQLNVPEPGPQPAPETAKRDG